MCPNLVPPLVAIKSFKIVTKDPEWRHDDKPFIAAQSKYPGISFGYQRFYIINNEPSVRTQLSRCLRHYHSEVKGRALWGGLSVDFVTGSVGG